MSGLCIEVPPLARKDIRALANEVRSIVRLRSDAFPIVQFMEFYSVVDDEFVYEICSLEEMGENHGLTFPDEKRMHIRQDVYERALAGQGRDRLTIAHEFGHLLMHRAIGFARPAVQRDQIEPFRSSEWQANCFGGELLIPASKINPNDSPFEIANKFAVSQDAASTQLRAYKREGII